MRERILSYILIVLLLFCAVSSLFLARGKSVKLASRNRIGLVKIYGLISVMPSRGNSVFGLRGSDRIVQQIKRLRKIEVKAVVIRINSPGGTIGACQEIVEEIRKLKKDGIPVVASMGDVAASGGYYVASACDKILLNRGTMTGSIGVMMGSSNFEELLDKVGIKPEIIKSGKYKDMGAYYREFTDEERGMVQDMVDDTYSQFLEAVAEGRNIHMEKLKSLAQGQVFTGSQALENGLADGIGNLNTAVLAAKDLAELKGEVEVIEEPGPFEKFFNIVYDGPETVLDLLRFL
ncbi:MAG: signal peptide peptidase SppA [bacterium]